MTSSGGTDEFENASLFEMQNMIANAKPADLIDRGYHLMAAAEEFQHIGTSLAKYTQDVEWQGEGADAFRDWTHQLAKDTASLAEYTNAVSKHMVEAGASLALAKAIMPPLPSDATLCYTDPAKAAQAQASLEAARQEAIPVMNSLSSTYRVTAESLNALTPPTFKPLPGSIVGPVRNEQIDFSERRFMPTEGSSGPGSLRAPVTESGKGHLPGETDPVAGARTLNVGNSALHEQARTRLDAAPVTTVPAEKGAHPHGGLTPGMTVPSQDRVSGEGSIGSFQKPRQTPNESPVTGIIGGERVPTGRGASSPLPNEVLGDEGISGGIPIGTRTTTPRFPRGLVIGEEPVTATPANTAGWGSQGAVQHEIAGASSAAESWSSPGSHTEPAQGNAVQQARETSSAGPGGFPASAGTAAGSDPKPRRARPDYLVEDDETWQPKRYVTPPVIG